MDLNLNETVTKLPFKSHYLEILGSKMHYLDEGQGDPILFLHGIPTWSYLWRNIIPAVSDLGRCIAVDLIGLGRSDKPKIDYRIFDHIKYIEAFINKLNLKNVTLVMHGWGSVVGFDYAMRNEANIKALAFCEAYIHLVTEWEKVSLPVQELSTVIHSPDGGQKMIMKENYFVNKVLPTGTSRKLSAEEMAFYREPFAKPGSCVPIWQYVQDFPFGDGPHDVLELIDNYTNKLVLSKIPKLMVYCIPGFLTTVETVHWAKKTLTNLSLVEIGDALHYVPEGKPLEFRKILRNWYKEIVT